MSAQSSSASISERLPIEPEHCLELLRCIETQQDTASYRIDNTGYVRRRGRGGKGIGTSSAIREALHETGASDIGSKEAADVELPQQAIVMWQWSLSLATRVIFYIAWLALVIETSMALFLLGALIRLARADR